MAIITTLLRGALEQKGIDIDGDFIELAGKRQRWPQY